LIIAEIRQLTLSSVLVRVHWNEVSFHSIIPSERAFKDLVRKISRAIADLAGRGDIRIEDIAEAITLRSLDKKYWS